MRFSATLAVALIAVVTTVNAETVKLQWGNSSSSSSQPVAKSSTSTQQQSALRFVKPGVGSATSSAAPSHVDAHIKLTAYETNGPRLASARDTDTGTRSVVVNRESDPAEGFRSAQKPDIFQNPNPPAAKGSSDDALRQPFGDDATQPNNIPMPPEAGAGQNNAAQSNGAGQTLPVPTNPNAGRNNNLQVDPTAPRNDDFANPGGPEGSPQIQNDTGQFQPILPAGPGPDQSPPLQSGVDAAKIRAEGEKAKESCDKSLENLKAYTVDKVNLTIAITGTEGTDYPFECAIDNGQMHAGRCWEQITYMWKASAMCHKPLYFEDEQLERYGHSFSPCIQPFVSGAHFFTRPFVLPYCMGVEPPNECIYALGYYRPGSCAPYMCNPIPLSLRGALFEAGAVTGVAAAIP